MTAPNIDLFIQPSVDSVVRYLVLAPSKPGDPVRYQLSFQAAFKNRSAQSMRIDRIHVSMPGFAEKDIAVRTANGNSFTEGLQIAAGATKAPMDFKNTDNIVLTSAPPQTIKFAVYADGDDDEPAIRFYALGRHVSPVAGGAYAWPGKAHDLSRGELWTGTGAQHCCGPQLYAHDLNVEAFDASAKVWSMWYPNTARTKNEDYRVWGKPVYAMADGTVDSFLFNVPTNTDMSVPLASSPTYGNHFLLNHGSDLMLYAHLQRDSLPAALRSKGAVVHAGDFLGRVGNSGNAYGPHLHIHNVEKSSGTLRPIPWLAKSVATKKATARAKDVDWHVSSNQGLKVVETLIYPGDAPPADEREWSDWSSIGGQFLYGPCVSSWAANRLDVFGIGTDRALWHKAWNGSQWSEWFSLGGQFNARPAAVSWAKNRIDVFCRGTDNALWHRCWSGSSWQAWESRGGTWNSGPAVSSRASNRLDIFIEATDDTLWHQTWNGSSWTPWQSLGGNLTAGAAAVSWNSSRVDLFGRATDGTLYQKWWNGSAWSEWTAQSRAMQYGAAVSSRKANHLDVFLVAPDGALQHRLWTGSKWSYWESLGGKLTGDPAAVSWNSKRIDVFGRGTDNSVYHTRWQPAS